MCKDDTIKILLNAWAFIINNVFSMEGMGVMGGYTVWQRSSIHIYDLKLLYPRQDFYYCHLFRLQEKKNDLCVIWFKSKVGNLLQRIFPNIFEVGMN